MRTASSMPAVKRGALLTAIAMLATPLGARAQPYDTPSTWGGDFWSRPRLTGSWAGVRYEPGKKGVVFDVDLLVTPQDVVSGGRSTDGNLWGNVDGCASRT
jgi:porin